MFLQHMVAEIKHGKLIIENVSVVSEAISILRSIAYRKILQFPNPRVWVLMGRIVLKYDMWTWQQYQISRAISKRQILISRFPIFCEIIMIYLDNASTKLVFQYTQRIYNYNVLPYTMPIFIIVRAAVAAPWVFLAWTITICLKSVNAGAEYRVIALSPSYGNCSNNGDPFDKKDYSNQINHNYVLDICTVFNNGPCLTMIYWARIKMWWKLMYFYSTSHVWNHPMCC